MDMSARRIVLVNALIAVIIGTFAYSIVWEVEAFPFSPFPMYSKSRAGVTESKRLAYVGITAEGEVPLSRRQLEEIARTRKKYLDRYVNRTRLGRPELVLAMLAKLTALADVYGHSLPARPIPTLEGMRIYRQVFTVDPFARNRRRPDESVLLFEFRRPPPGGTPE